MLSFVAQAGGFVAQAGGFVAQAGGFVAQAGGFVAQAGGFNSTGDMVTSVLALTTLGGIAAAGVYSFAKNK